VRGAHLADRAAALLDRLGGHAVPSEGVAASRGGVAIDDGHRPGVLDRQKAEVRFVRERVLPQLPTAGRELVVDGVPGELEPLVGPLEEETACDA